jgi:hypothetical protein
MTRLRAERYSAQARIEWVYADKIYDKNLGKKQNFPVTDRSFLCLNRKKERSAG